MRTITLQSSDHVIFKVDVEVAKCSGTIKTMLEDLGISEDNAEVIPLPNVSSNILKRVIDYCIQHKDDPIMPDDEEDEKRTDNVKLWDSEFLKASSSREFFLRLPNLFLYYQVDQGTLFELVLAANYLHVRPLLNVCCKTVAGMITGKSPEEIRKTFNITNDWTPEELEQVRQENTWCEER